MAISKYLHFSFLSFTYLYVCLSVNDTFHNPKLPDQFPVYKCSVWYTVHRQILDRPTLTSKFIASCLKLSMLLYYAPPSVLYFLRTQNTDLLLGEGKQRWTKITIVNFFLSNKNYFETKNCFDENEFLQGNKLTEFDTWVRCESLCVSNEKQRETPWHLRTI